MKERAASFAAMLGSPFPTGAPVSFRQALIVAAAMLVTALSAMGAVTAMALSDADRLLDRLDRSQNQLARVTAIEADINALLLVAYENAPPVDQQSAIADIDRQISDYLATIAAERSVIGVDPAVLATQAEEARQGEALAAVISELRRSLDERAGSAEPSTAELEQRRRLRQLAERIQEKERIEARDAIEQMLRLKNRTTNAAYAILAAAVLLCLIGAAAMSASLGRPLRLLEEAANCVSRGDVASAPVEPTGFTEIRHVAEAFNRLDAEVGAQRQALAQHNQDLEAQVANRTREIEASNARLAEIDQTRRLFFSKVSHELRTPATVIRSEAEVALRKSGPAVDDLREALEHVAANSAFLQRRLDDLLALARAEDGRITLRREPISLSGLLNDVIALAEPYTRSSGMALIEQGVDQADAVVVLGDASWLQQALLALVDNAAKFAIGSPALRLSLHTGQGAATISVADGGPGVSPEALPFLFDSFYQAPGTSGAGGAGLGLSVTRWVVEQHGGQVSARNVEGQGLLIELRLPIAS